MANTLESEIIRVLQKCADEIRGNMQAAGVNASGRTADSVRVREIDGYGLQLVAGRDGSHEIEAGRLGTIEQRDTAPFPTVEIGRPAGRVPFGFRYIISEWSREKGITFGNERERSTFAYFLARRIAREGTLRNNAKVDVYSTAVTNAADKIRAICQQYVATQIQAAVGGLTITTQTNF